MYEYVDSTHLDYEKVTNTMIYQGADICRNKISKNYLQNVLKNATYSFVNYGKIAQIGQKRTSPIKEYYIQSFIICNVFPDQMIIKLICARPTSKDGKELMKMAEKKAKQDGIPQIALFSICETSLVNWYKKQGYEVRNTIMYDDDDNKPKVYYMIKYI